MPYCAVVGCKTGNKMPGRMQYQSFKLPETKGMKAKWIEKINRDFIPNENTRVCAKHFKSSDFVPAEENLDTNKKPKKKMTLKSSAIPSLFLKDPKEEKTRGTNNSTVVPEEPRAANQEDIDYVDYLHTYSKPPENEPDEVQELPKVNILLFWNHFRPLDTLQFHKFVCN
jgi:hypothetical protein